MHTHRTRIAMTVFALLVAVGGCDADGDDTAAAVEDGNAVVVTDEDADTDVVVDDIDGLVVVEGSDEAAAALAEAVAATRTVDGVTAFDVTFDGVAASDGVIGEGTSSGGDVSATMLVRGELAELRGATDVEVEVRIVGDTVYLYWPALLADADLDASWVSSRVADGDLDIGGLVDRARLASPREALALLDGATNVAELEDGEFIGGAATTHYVATVELGAAVAAGTPGTAFFGEPDRALEVHAFVDGDGLVRRVEVTGQRDGSTLVYAVDVLATESDVVIEPPPADDVVSFAAYLAARG